MSDQRPAPRRPALDVPITVALLLIGLINATTAFAGAPDYGDSLDSTLTSLGAEHYSRYALAAGCGYAIAGCTLLCLVLAIGFAVPRLRVRRTAFWIPLVCGAIATLASLVFGAVALVGDPAWASLMQVASQR